MSEDPHPHADVTDDALPPDLVPSEDNPLAEPLADGETAGDLLHDGKHADQDEPESAGDSGG
ncbi:hypothetical protein K8Z61_15320 [Nocardioides sp. TRM66260-LWL]|uniref:hypothetical protein n=1 Tax=Nocardioides sp. TRM66260-LWL TaxID=2874478 RepID=UPI001CC46227|nr:hypothetical protein [Nocardioides sp. TRM66260-LWL]MBZ5735863.1 hypothetical protein [Nocardioides sp. TRM66260-LWL]